MTTSLREHCRVVAPDTVLQRPTPCQQLQPRGRPRLAVQRVVLLARQEPVPHVEQVGRHAAVAALQPQRGGPLAAGRLHPAASAQVQERQRGARPACRHHVPVDGQRAQPLRVAVPVAAHLGRRGPRARVQQHHVGRGAHRAHARALAQRNAVHVLRMPEGQLSECTRGGGDAEAVQRGCAHVARVQAHGQPAGNVVSQVTHLGPLAWLLDLDWRSAPREPRAGQVHAPQHHLAVTPA
mmetsp:Transcript_12910/g.31653  ORF Transcript_12910/g.31653 Transcript_12910/m.31653 type:complete len:238 (+) Transcript_12910:167-880(+)